MDVKIFYSLFALYVTYDANNADCTSHLLKKSLINKIPETEATKER